MYFLFSYQYNGDITAYGGGNDNNLNSVKAGPGTVYINYGENTIVKPKLLKVNGDTTDGNQQQTHTIVSGTKDSDFQYLQVSLKGG